MHHAWPGNIRELRNYIERAVILTKGDVLQLPSLPHMPIKTEAVTLADAERDHILRALEESNWVVGGKFGAAARLGLARTTLIAKMKKHGLSSEIARSRVLSVTHSLPAWWRTRNHSDLRQLEFKPNWVVI